MRKPSVRNYFNRPGSLAGAINFASSLDRTHQEFKDECDINNIIRRYSATGLMPQPWKSPPRPLWGDFASAPDFLEAQNKLIEAQRHFRSLPSRVRNRFNNNPAELLAFVHDPANQKEAEDLGLAVPVQAPPAPSP